MKELIYHLGSDATYQFTVEDIPVGRSLESFWFRVQWTRADDEDALIEDRAAVTVAGAVATVKLLNDDFVGVVAPVNLFFFTKALLDSGDAVATNAEGVLRVLPRGVVRTV